MTIVSARLACLLDRFLVFRKLKQPIAIQKLFKGLIRVGSLDFAVFAKSLGRFRETLCEAGGGLSRFRLILSHLLLQQLSEQIVEFRRVPSARRRAVPRGALPLLLIGARLSTRAPLLLCTLLIGRRALATLPLLLLLRFLFLRFLCLRVRA